MHNPPMSEAERRKRLRYTTCFSIWRAKKRAREAQGGQSKDKAG